MSLSTSGPRVLQVVEATTAGVGWHVSDLSIHLHRAGIDVVVACPSAREGAVQDTGFVHELRAAGLTVALVPMRRHIDPPADLRAILSLVKLMRYETFDVVHVHSSKAGVLGRLAALAVRNARGPVVAYTPNAFAHSGAGRRLSLWFYRAIERWLGHHATDALICVSGSEMRLARKHRVAPADRLNLIENTVEVSSLAYGGTSADAKSDLGLDPTCLVVGFIGRLAVQKGPQWFVRAARLILDAGREAQFLVVGEGELDAQLRQMAAADHLGDRLLFLGYREDVPLVLAALDIFVLPSLYEGLPYAVLEAMAAGRAVVATDVGGNRDLVQHRETGLLVPPQDAAALADAVMHLLAHPEERERLGKMALAAARSRPSPEERSCRTIDLYSRLLSHRRGGVG